MQKIFKFIKEKGGYFFLVFAFVALFGFGFWAGKNSVACQVCQPDGINFSLFWQAWNTLKDTYVDPSKFNTQEMVYGAISGMVNSLGDPYTVFFKPDENKKFIEDVTGSFEGVGMEVGKKKNQLQVVAPLDGTPAQKAGLRAGDKILKIDKTDTNDLTVEEAVSLIRGQKGTDVVLTIYRDGWDTSKEITIKRGVIDVPVIKWELKGDTAYLKLYQFSETASTEFQRAAREILASPAKKIVLDLRNDPGGYLEIAQEISGWFLERGKTVVTEDFGGKKANESLLAEGNARFAGYPTVILINEGSASASEILAAALRENRDNVKMVGKTSYGKGSVQEVKPLPGDASLKITVAKWLTPKGNQINEVGLTPDIPVELTDEDFQNNKDPQLDKALEIINEMN